VIFLICKNSESKKVSTSVELTLNRGGTSASRNLTKVCDFFSCTVDNLLVKKERFEEREPNGPALRMRDGSDYTILEKAEIEELLNVLCTE
jgi:hypothetical protein